MLRLPWNPFKYPFYSLRTRLVHPVMWVLFVLSPLLNWFRVDMLPATMGGQHLIWLGRAYPFESQYLQWIPFCFYGGVIVVAVVSAVLGRLFCGWVCPHNIMTEWTRWLRALFPLGAALGMSGEPMPRWIQRWIRRQPSVAPWLKALAPLVGLAWCFAMTVLLFTYVIPPAFIVQNLLSGNVHIALAFGLTLFTLIGLFLLYLGHNFCRICCPYGMAQSLPLQTGKIRPMAIGFTGSQANDCQSCHGCQTACPVDIDPRRPENLIVGNFDGCFNCGECIDACAYIRQDRSGTLLSFTWPNFLSSGR
jgi:ferredoxin-type protein NapH